MMTSSHGNIFRVTGHLCKEFTGPRWIPRTKASDAELWWICTWINGWENNGEAGDLRHHGAHYDVTVMTLRWQVLWCFFMLAYSTGHWAGLDVMTLVWHHCNSPGAGSNRVLSALRGSDGVSRISSSRIKSNFCDAIMQNTPLVGKTTNSVRRTSFHSWNAK